MRALACLAGLALSGCYDFSIFDQTDAVDARRSIADAAAGMDAGLNVGSDMAMPPAGWATLPSSPGPQDLYGVWGTSPTNVYAVGTSSLIARWNGVKWTAEDVSALVGGSATLEGVYGSGPTDVWVVGDTQGVVLHSTGNGGWTRTTITGVTAELFAVWVAGDGAATAVGDLGTVVHYDPAKMKWSDDSLAAGVDLGRVIAVTGGGPGANSLIAAGGDGGKLILAHAAMPAVWSRTQAGMDEIDSLWTDGTEIFVGTNGGTVLHSVNAGTHFADAQSPLAAAGRSMFGMWGSSAKQVYAVGGNGAIIRWDGAAWTVESFPTPTELRAMWGTAGEGFIVGKGGLVLHRNF